MAKIYVYALYCDEFETREHFKNGDSTNSYFYVGRTSNIERRKKQHESKARCGSSYPYHEKIRSLDIWDIEELASVDEDLISDHEEYYMMKLTCEGHPLLNIKQGDRIRQNAKEFISILENAGVKNNSDYSKLLHEDRKNKILHRERQQIKRQLKHIKYDPQTEQHIYSLNGEIQTTEKYMKKSELIDFLCPSVNVDLFRLVKRVQELVSVVRENA
jgi:hypothetical protein